MASIDPISRDYAACHGTLCALVRWTPAQRRGYLLAVLALAACLAWSPFRTWVVLSYVLALFFFCALAIRLAAIAIAVWRDPTRHVTQQEVDALDPATLPSYSILVPLFREPEVVPELLAALGRLDYPAAKLDVQLILEPGDADTLAALRRHALPPHLRVTLAPEGPPQTKPRACNTALAQARGEFLVVFDAEDRPDPDQLKKAVAAYRGAPPEVVCLQCRLAHYNSMQGIFAQWSAMEYLVWYRLVLPGLQRLGAAMPLGGTSNHFRTAALREIGGWDPFNVTEDCDLGMRLARRGWRTWMIDSTTWEESVTTAGAWVRQRSRWVKGYWQTWLVHSRGGAVRAFGTWPWLLFLLTVGVGTLMLLLNPAMWVAMFAWLAIGWPIMDVNNVFSVAAMIMSFALMGANAVFVLTNMVGCLLCRRPDLIPVAFVSPLEWVLLSVAAWKGMWQFFTQPFRWEKTAHGRAVSDAEIRHRRHWLIKATHPTLSFLFLFAIMAATAGLLKLRVDRQIRAQQPVRAVQQPRRFPLETLAAATPLAGFGRDAAAWQVTGAQRNAFAPNPRHPGSTILRANVSFPGKLDVATQPQADWTGCQGVVMYFFVPADAPQGMRVFLHLRERQRLWYQHASPQRLLPGEWTRVEAGLGAADGWRGEGHRKPWGAYGPQFVREFGVTVVCHTNFTGCIQLAAMRAIPRAPAAAAAAVPAEIRDWQQTPPTPLQFGKLEATFAINRAYANPFDPDVVDVSAEFSCPDGQTRTVPAFFHQDYTRRLVDGRERLFPVGAENWKVRFTPPLPGAYTYRLRLREPGVPEVVTPPRAFEAHASDNPGFIRIYPRDPHYLAFDNGKPYYPIGHNICTPVDPLEPYPYEFPKQRDQASFTYERFMERMAHNGENWARLWMVPWGVGLEGHADWDGFHGVGRYSLENAWRLDYLVDLATRLNMRLQLTMDHKSEFSLSWEWNPYRAALGGPLRSPYDFFDNVKTMQAYRKRLRYIVARWGYSPNIVAWELWGEVNLMPGYRNQEDTVAAWHRDMSRYLRTIDPWRHLVFTHCHDWQAGDALWALPEIDCIQGNGYIRPPNRSVNHLVNFRGYVDDVFAYNKPIFVAEFGGRSEQGAPSGNYLEAQLHSGIWASLVSPVAGTAMHWWWNFIDGKDLYFHYRALAAFCARIERIGPDYRSVWLTVEHPRVYLNAAGMQATDRGFFWVHHPDVFFTLKNIPAATGARLTIPRLTAGTYEVEFWDTYKGEALGRVELPCDGRLEIPLPKIDKDLALRFKRLR